MRCVLQARRGMGFTEVFCLPPPSFLLPGAVAPHPRVCVVCVVLWRRWGFLRGVCLFFFWFFMVSAGGFGEWCWVAWSIVGVGRMCVGGMLMPLLGRGEQWGYLVEVVGWETYN